MTPVKPIAAAAMVILVASGLLAGCASQKRTVGSERMIAGGPAPGWTVHPRQGDMQGAKAFVGLSMNEASDAQARTGALDNARTQIVDSMGVLVSRRLNQLIAATGTPSSVIVPQVASADLRKLVSEGDVSTWADDWYIQKWERTTPYGVEHYYKAYVLVHVPAGAASSVLSTSTAGAIKALPESETRTALERALEGVDEMGEDDW